MKYYVYDATTKAYVDTVEADTQPDNSTTISPFTINNGVEVAPIGVSFINGAWAKPSSVTAEQRMIAKLGADVAQSQQMIAQIAAMIMPQGGQNDE